MDFKELLFSSFPSGNPSTGVLLRADEIHLWRFPIGQGSSAAQRTVAHKAIQWILTRYLNANAPSNKELVINEYGKPRLVESRWQPFEFNLTHSGIWGLLAIGRVQNLGVDIELIRNRSTPVCRVMKRVATAYENACWQALPVCEQLAAFYWLWTAKEAVLKAMGTGFNISPVEIEIETPFAASSRVHRTGQDQMDYELISYRMQEYMIALACPMGKMKLTQRYTLPEDIQGLLLETSSNG